MVHILLKCKDTEIVRKTFECHTATHKRRSGIQESNQFQQDKILNIYVNHYMNIKMRKWKYDVKKMVQSLE
jgi:hypothetical protein